MNANKRIAFNTSILYVKLIISIIVGLYTSRLVLQALGASDFGLYSVVGGIVTLLNTIGITMVSTSYRYISVALGKGDKGNINKVYNTIFTIHLVLAIFLLVVGSIVGTWYIENYLNVLDSKRPDALFVLYASLITSSFFVISIPSNGLIVAREKFLFTSFVEILQFLFKLVVILLFLVNYDGNRLRLYAILLAIGQMIQPLTYTLYSYIKDRNVTRWSFNACWADYKEIIIFTWWLLCGAVCVLGNNQGAAVIMNLFFGTIVNAAYGIAMQVQNYILMFVRNLVQATSPQIMKNFGAGNEERSLMLVYKISKYCFFVLLLIAVPAIISIREVLHLWLGEVPEYTDVFVILLLINGLVACLNSGFDALIQASGKIRNNQIGYSLINISLLPIVYVLYKFKSPCYVNVFVMIALSVLTIVFQCFIMKKVSSFKYLAYFKATIVPSGLTGIVASIAIVLMWTRPTVDISTMMGNTGISFLWVSLSVLFVGLNQAERTKIKNIITEKIIRRYGKHSGIV